MRATILRLVSVLGERYTHGHVFDFYKGLRSNPNELRVLGDGHQRKSYLYVQDCIDAILELDRKAPRKQRHTAHRIWERLRAELPDARSANGQFASTSTIGNLRWY